VEGDGATGGFPAEPAEYNAADSAAKDGRVARVSRREARRLMGLSLRETGKG
jgi:hypothetical protein